jgi:hypothetical protein
MNMIEHSIRKRAAFAFAITIALSLLSCDNRYNTSTLIINQIIDPIGANPVVYVALSRAPDFKGGIKTYAATYDMASPSSPAVVFESINWESKNEGGAGEFWLLVAQDANSTNVIDDLDNILPAMRVILEDGETTTIDRVIFDSTVGPPAKRVNGVIFSQANRVFRIFIEDPALLSMTNRMYLRIGNLVDLSNVANADLDIPIADTSLSSGLSLPTSLTNGFIWIDANGNGILQAGDGDWISTVSPAAAPPLTDFNQIILWSGQTY